MFNETLEADLIQYSMGADNDLFTARLYEPLCNLFKWLCSKLNVVFNNADFQDVLQSSLLRIINDIKRYTIQKGMSAISYVRMLMQQEIVLRKNQIDRKRMRASQYEDRFGVGIAKDNISHSINFNDVLNKYLITAPPAHKPVIIVIRDTLNDLNIIGMKQLERIDYYSRQAGVSKYLVYQVIKEIKRNRLYVAGNNFKESFCEN